MVACYCFVGGWILLVIGCVVYWFWVIGVVGCCGFGCFVFVISLVVTVLEFLLFCLLGWVGYLCLLIWVWWFVCMY